MVVLGFSHVAAIVDVERLVAEHAFQHRVRLLDAEPGGEPLRSSRQK